jgi:hypothetical protein
MTWSNSSSSFAASAEIMESYTAKVTGKGTGYSEEETKE